ncbi:NRDE family protein [Salarchaeum japonicum]|uniref:NRDE family protein n=1 Tax=Salarchaeum japonicum TaxID=555573 RepID=UPI001D0A8568|nr:NRDE family protein [Salarchaeum japonicum]
MCTLILAWRAFPDAPVVVAANRDESVNRPSTPPRVRDWERPALAPADERAGGTWMGVTDTRLFVGITNRRADGVEGERSRGLLVRDALEEPTADAARDRVRAELDEHDYDGFNLVLADADDAVRLSWDGTLTEERLDPGVHVVVNTGYAPPERAPAVRDALPPTDGDPDAWLDETKAVLRDHDVGACVHHEDRGFGTRSSSLVRIDSAGDVRFDYADGPPCRTKYDPADDRNGHI